jgi:hypothetical protein
MAYDTNIEVYDNPSNGGIKVVIRKAFTREEDVKEILSRAFDGEEIILKARIIDRKKALIKLNSWGMNVEKYL